jgi:hypothetical protein
MKEKLLSFAFNFFCESGLFKGLQPIQMKKIFSRVTLWLVDHKRVFLSPLLGAGRHEVHIRTTERH